MKILYFRNAAGVYEVLKNLSEELDYNLDKEELKTIYSW
jgi:hypothetical protein